jgi:hypothetical protein
MGDVFTDDYAASGDLFAGEFVKKIREQGIIWRSPRLASW